MEPILSKRRLSSLVPFALLAGAFGGALLIASGARLERADFVFNNGTEVQTLDPATVTGVPEGRMLRMIYEGLCGKDPKTLKPIPGTAESWEISKDGKTYTFKIRDDARWSNGDVITAEDFVWSFKRFLHPATAAEYAYQLWYVVGAEAYSSWPDRVHYVDDTTWVELLEDGTVRLGVTDRALGPRGPLESFRVGEAEGEVEEGALLGRLKHMNGKASRVESPVAGRIKTFNPKWTEDASAYPDQWSTSEGWLVELDVDETTRAALAALPDGPTFREDVLWPRVGIRAKDPHTLVFELENRLPYFLELMAFYPMFPVNRKGIESAQERWPDSWEIEWLRPENLITNGPYTIEFRRVRDRIRLRKNPQYWNADGIAFETVDALAVEHYGTSLNLYLTGECDWINASIPNNLVPRLLAREDFDPSPYLGTYFYRVNTTKPPLDDPRVRRALAMTIDRVAICERITKAGQQPAFALVPPGLRGYTQQNFGEEGIEAARKLLKQAGYGPGGKAFPKIEVHYNTSETHRDIAEVIADSWKRTLGIDVQLLNQEWKVYLDTQSNLKYDVSRSAWIGDYPDPNTFLDMFVTDGENNKTGWGSAKYDGLIAKASAEGNAKRRMKILEEAEAILMEELPILPIYFYSAQNMVNPRLGGFFGNLQDEHFPQSWYWMDDEELAEKREKLPRRAQQVEAPGPSGGMYPPSHEKYRPRERTAPE